MATPTPTSTPAPINKKISYQMATTMCDINRHNLKRGERCLFKIVEDKNTGDKEVFLVEKLGLTQRTAQVYRDPVLFYSADKLDFEDIDGEQEVDELCVEHPLLSCQFPSSGVSLDEHGFFHEFVDDLDVKRAFENFVVPTDQFVKDGAALLQLNNRHTRLVLVTSKDRYQFMSESEFANFIDDPDTGFEVDLHIQVITIKRTQDALAQFANALAMKVRMMEQESLRQEEQQGSEPEDAYDIDIVEIESDRLTVVDSRNTETSE